MPDKKDINSTPSYKKHLQKTLDFTKKLPSRKPFQFFLLWLSPWLILMSFLLSEIVKGENYIEVFPIWIVVPTLVHFATALVIATVIYLFKVPKNLSSKLVATVVLALFFANYGTRLTTVSGIFSSTLPILPDPSSGTYMATISIIFIAVLFGLAIGIGVLVDKLQSKKPDFRNNNIALAVIVVVGFIFVGQAIKAIPTLLLVHKESSVEAMSLDSPEGEPDKKKPDIYYLVFDRYANNQVLKDQLGYDNSGFSNSLRDEGFTVNDNAYSNYPFTSMSIASTLSADYTNEKTEPFENEEIQSRTLYHTLTYQSPVIKALKQNGYAYHNVGSIYGSSAKAPLADVDHMYDLQIEVFGKKKRLRGIEQSTVTESIFYQFMNMGDISWWPFKTYNLDEAQYATSQLSVLNQLAREDSGGRFIFSHVLIPHPGFLFNADGSYNDYFHENNYDKTINQKYLDQVTFINGQIERLVKTINEKSNNEAVIIINADEGPYPTAMNIDLYDGIPEPSYIETIHKGDTRDWPDEWMQMKYGILQAVHIPKATENDMSHLSSVNAFRIVLNRYLGYDLPYLPQCHLGLEYGNIKQYNQVDITKRLMGETSEFCEELVK